MFDLADLVGCLDLLEVEIAGTMLGKIEIQEQRQRNPHEHVQAFADRLRLHMHPQLVGNVVGSGIAAPGDEEQHHKPHEACDAVANAVAKRAFRQPVDGARTARSATSAQAVQWLKQFSDCNLRCYLPLPRPFVTGENFCARLPVSTSAV